MKKRRNKGIALLVVLGAIVLFASLTGMLVALTHATNVCSRVTSDRARGRQIAETALADALWFALSQQSSGALREGVRRRSFTSTEPTDEEPVWLPDGRPYSLKYGNFTVEFRIFDANRGFDIAGVNPGVRLRQRFQSSVGPDTELDPELDSFFDVLDDYVDGDDLTRLLGLERRDYEHDGLERFPRNGVVKFREEAYWLGGIERLFGSMQPKLGQPLPPDAIRIIPPVRARFPSKPSFFSSSPEMIRVTAQLTPDELDQALSARDLYYRDQIPVQESLGGLYSKIGMRMSMGASTIYSIAVRVVNHSGDVGRESIATMDTRRLFSTEQPPYIIYWQHQVN